MIITASREDLASAISRASAGLSPRPANPVHAGMFLRTQGKNELELTCCDGEISFTALCAAEVRAEGTAVLPGKMLEAVSRYFPGESVSLECDGTTAAVTAGKSRFVLPSGEPGDFPLVPVPPVYSRVKAESADLRRVIRNILPAAGTGSAAYESVYLTPLQDKIRMICTSRETMGMDFLPLKAVSPSFPPALVPVKVMERFAKAAEGEAELGWDENVIVLSSALRVISPQAGMEKFADWRELLENRVLSQVPQEGWVSAGKDELVSAVKMAALADERITLGFAPGELIITSAGQEGRSSDSIPLEGYSGDAVSFAFGAGTLLGSLGGCGEIAEFAWSRAVFVRDGSFLFSMQPRRRE